MAELGGADGGDEDAEMADLAKAAKDLGKFKIFDFFLENPDLSDAAMMREMQEMTKKEIQTLKETVKVETLKAIEFNKAEDKPNALASLKKKKQAEKELNEIYENNPDLKPQDPAQV